MTAGNSSWKSFNVMQSWKRRNSGKFQIRYSINLHFISEITYILVIQQHRNGVNFFQVAHLIFFWFISMTPNFYQALKKIWVLISSLKNLRWHSIKIWLDALSEIISTQVRGTTNYNFAQKKCIDQFSWKLSSWHTMFYSNNSHPESSQGGLSPPGIFLL